MNSANRRVNAWRLLTIKDKTDNYYIVSDGAKIKTGNYKRKTLYLPKHDEAIAKNAKDLILDMIYISARD